MINKHIGSLLSTLLLIAIVLLQVFPLILPSTSIKTGVVHSQANMFTRYYSGSTPIVDVAVDSSVIGDVKYIYIYVASVDPGNPDRLTIYSLDPSSGSLLTVATISEPSFISVPDGVALEAADSKVFVAYATSPTEFKVWMKDSTTLTQLMTINSSVSGRIIDLYYVQGSLILVASNIVVEYNGTSINTLYTVPADETIISSAYRNNKLYIVIGNTRTSGTGVTAYSDYKDIKLWQLGSTGFTNLYTEVYLRDLIDVSISSIDDTLYAIYDQGTYSLAKEPFSTQDYFYNSSNANAVPLFIENTYVIGKIYNAEGVPDTVSLLHDGVSSVEEIIDTYSNAADIYYQGSDSDDYDIVFALEKKDDAGNSEYYLYATSASNIAVSPLASSGIVEEFSHFAFQELKSHFDQDKWYDPLRVLGPYTINYNATVTISRYYLVTRVRDYDINNNVIAGNPGAAIFSIDISSVLGVNITSEYSSQGVIDPYDAMEYIPDKSTLLVVVAGGSVSDNTASILYYNTSSRTASIYVFPEYTGTAITALIPITFVTDTASEDRAYGVLSNGTIVRILVNPSDNSVSLINTGLSLVSFNGGRNNLLLIHRGQNYVLLAAILNDQARTLAIYNFSITTTGTESLTEVSYLQQVYDPSTTFVRDSLTVVNQQGELEAIYIVGSANGNGTIWYYNTTSQVITILYTNNAYDLYDIEYVTVFNTQLTVVVGGKIIPNGAEVIVLRITSTSTTEAGNYAHPAEIHNFGFKVIVDLQASNPIFIVFSHGSPQGIVLTSGTPVTAQPLPVPEMPPYISIIAVVMVLLIIGYLQKRRK